VSRTDCYHCKEELRPSRPGCFSFQDVSTTDNRPFPDSTSSPLFPAPRYLAHRAIFSELMDDFEGPQKQYILRDLERINRWFGARRAISKAFVPLAPPQQRFSVLDIGAASGNSGRYLRSLYPLASVVSLDYRAAHLVSNDGVKVVADAFRLPFRRKSFDFVFSSLFLHHFDDETVIALFRHFSEIAVRGIIAVDLLRHRFAYHFLPLTSRLFGWHRISVHDGIRSVQASFTRPELLHLAVHAGLVDPVVATIRPFFRLALTAKPNPE
jgi:SAM-dependent methyltransferase